MAGIAGYIGNRVKDDAELIDAMTAALQYTEEEICDQWQDNNIALSRVHHGVVNSEKQPIFNEDGSLLIFMDGEVFRYESYKELLLSKGHRFKSERNNAEFCLHLYEHMGYDSFEKLNGSFLIALYNTRSHELILVNDRFASFTSYYYITKSGTLMFSTQLSSLLASNEIPRRLNIRSLFEFFTFQKVLSSNTLLDGINTIPPATILRYSRGKISLRPYWWLQYIDEIHPNEYYSNKLAELLVNSVQNKTADNRRFGILLSGGLDSRSIFAASKQKMVCFTAADFENREVKVAKKIAATRQCKHIFLKRSLDHYMELLDRAIELGSGMYRFTHAHNIGFFDEIRKECDVLLHGYGIDSLFKKYFYLPERKIILFNKEIASFTQPLNDVNKELISIILNGTLYNRKVVNLFSEPYFGQYENIIKESIDETLSSAERSGAKDPYRKIDYFSSHSAVNVDAYLHLVHNRAYINERTAIFDNELFDLHLKIPPLMRVSSDIFKRALRTIDQDVYGIINANTGTFPWAPLWMESISLIALKMLGHVREKMANNKVMKQGSWPNFNELIRRNEKFRNLVWETVNDKNCLNQEIFNRANIRKLFDYHIERTGNYEEIFLLLLTFGNWYRKYSPSV